MESNVQLPRQWRIPGELLPFGRTGSAEVQPPGAEDERPIGAFAQRSQEGQQGERSQDFYIEDRRTSHPAAGGHGFGSISACAIKRAQAKTELKTSVRHRRKHRINQTRANFPRRPLDRQSASHRWPPAPHPSLDSKPRLVPHSLSMKMFPPLVLKTKALPPLFNVPRTELAFRWPAGVRSKSVITRPPLVLALMSKDRSGETLTRILPAAVFSAQSSSGCAEKVTEIEPPAVLAFTVFSALRTAISPPEVSTSSFALHLATLIEPPAVLAVVSPCSSPSSMRPPAVFTFTVELALASVISPPAVRPWTAP